MAVRKGKKAEMQAVVQRMHTEGLSGRKIAAETGLALSTVQNYLKPDKPKAVAEVANPAPARDLTGMAPLEMAIVAKGNTWAGRAEIAKAHCVPMGVVLSHFHRLRVLS